MLLKIRKKSPSSTSKFKNPWLFKVQTFDIVQKILTISPMFLPGLIIFFRIFSIKVSKIRFYLLHSGVMRIKVFLFDNVFILFFKEKASLIWKYKDIIIFHADYGDPISTEYGHIAMIVSAYALGKQIRDTRRLVLTAMGNWRRIQLFKCFNLFSS